MTMNHDLTKFGKIAKMAKLESVINYSICNFNCLSNNMIL